MTPRFAGLLLSSLAAGPNRARTPPRSGIVLAVVPDGSMRGRELRGATAPGTDPPQSWAPTEQT